MTRETKYRLSGIPGLFGWMMMLFGLLDLSIRFPELLLVGLGWILVAVSNKLLARYE